MALKRPSFSGYPMTCGGGEAVCAVVVGTSGLALKENEIADFDAFRLFGYKKPKRVEFRGELPKNAAWTVMKKLLRELYWAARDKRV